HRWQGVELKRFAGQALSAPHVGHRPPAAEPGAVTTPPDGLTLKHHRDLEGRERRPFVRWIVCGLLALFLVLGLANVFGQRPATSTASGPGAEFKIYSPTDVRGGLVFESRFHIKAVKEIRDATIVLDPGWLEGMTLN